MSRILLISLFLFASCSHFNSWNDPVHKKAAETAKYVNSPDYSKHRTPANTLGTCGNIISSIFGSNSTARETAMYEAAVKEGDELIESYDSVMKNSDMFDVWRKAKAEADTINQATMKYLDTPLEDNHVKRVASLDSNQRNKVYRAVDDHPVASQCQLRQYDPQGNMGFCFGRAMTAHLELLNSGVQKDKIRKLWAVGSFQAGGNNWRYHVTTIVKGDDGQWWAIDPIFGYPVSAKDWYSRMKGFDVGGDMVLFTSEAKRFGPSSPDQYNRAHLNLDAYNDYFNDLLKSYRENNGPFNGEVFKKPDVASVGELFRDAIASF